MKRTYVNRLPKNEEVKKANVRVENGQLFVEVEFEEKFEPKDGDFIKYECCGKEGIFIYKEGIYKDFCGCYCGIMLECGIGSNGRITISENNCYASKFYCRYATQEEKSAFLARLEKELNKKWNPETKKLENIRWRAEKGCDYFYIDSSVSIKPAKDNDVRRRLSSLRYMEGNYFRTLEAAQKVVDQIKDILKNSKAE